MTSMRTRFKKIRINYHHDSVTGSAAACAHKKPDSDSNLWSDGSLVYGVVRSVIIVELFRNASCYAPRGSTFGPPQTFDQMPDAVECKDMAR